MPHKTPGKTAPEPGRPFTPNEENLQSAYQIHTLAQIMYGQLYGVQPWIGPTGPALMPPTHQPWTPMANPVGGPWAAEMPSWTAPQSPYYTPPTGFHGPFFGYPCGCMWRR